MCLQILPNRNHLRKKVVSTRLSIECMRGYPSVNLVSSAMLLLLSGVETFIFFGYGIQYKRARPELGVSSLSLFFLCHFMLLVLLINSLSVLFFPGESFYQRERESWQWIRSTQNSIRSFSRISQYLLPFMTLTVSSWREIRKKGCLSFFFSFVIDYEEVSFFPFLFVRNGQKENLTCHLSCSIHVSLLFECESSLPMTRLSASLFCFLWNLSLSYKRMETFLSLVENRGRDRPCQRDIKMYTTEILPKTHDSRI
jgi:hypothetical protein